MFPSATHTRKEHSVGTAHLALLVVRHLRNTQPELCIDDSDELCVGLAALLHDGAPRRASHACFASISEVLTSEATEETAAAGRGRR